MTIFQWLLMIVFLIPINFGNAQTITLGTGTSQNAVTSASPINIWYRRTVCNFVYTAAELQAAGASSSTPITEIGWYVTQSPVYNIPGYSIRVKHTSQTNVATNLGSGGWTTIKNPFTYAPTAGGYDMIPMDNNFTWDGVSNLAVQVCWSRVNPTYNASGQVRIYNTPSGFRYRRTDANGSSCGANPNVVTGDKPQCRIVFIPGTSTIWTGAVSTDWFNASNWTVGVPNKNMDAEIPAGPSNMPEINGATGNVKKIGISPGASLTTVGTNTLNVYGNWSNSGNYVANNGTINFLGDSPNFIACSGTQTFYNLSIRNIYGSNIVAGQHEIVNSLNLEGGTFTTNNSITLLSSVSGTARIPEIKPVCAYELRMFDSYGDGWNGGFLDVLVDGVSIGGFAATSSNTTANFTAVHGASIQLVYSSGIYENENTYELYDPDGILIFGDGPSPSTGTVFTTTSSCSFVNPMVGNIEMQRYVDAGSTHWRFFSAAVAGVDLEQFDDDFVTSGIPGTDFPNWPTAADPWESFWLYDESQGTSFDDGFVAPSSTSHVLGVGEGIWAWCGDTITGTQPFNIEMVGPANAGDISLPVSFTVSSGSMDDDGWNMVANPYPCTIDWDSPNWIKTNIEDAVYIWNPDLQQYAAYISGASTNGGSNFISSSQAFMVHADASSPVLSINESCKVNQDQSFLKAGTVSTDLFRLHVNDGSNVDETIIRFDQGATNQFDKWADARKNVGNGVFPTSRLYTKYQGVNYAINTFNQDSIPVSVPLNFKAVNSGNHTISVTEDDALAGMSCVLLEDLLTGQWTNLITDTVYHFTATTMDAEQRFVIHFGDVRQIDVEDPLCHGDADGSILVNDLVPGTAYTFTNLSSGVVQNGMSTGSEQWSVLAAGNYVLELNAGSGQCPEDSMVLVITDPPAISPIVSEDPVSCVGCCDGEIDVVVGGGTPPYTINWTQALSGWNPTALCAGTYDYQVLDANGCELIGQAHVPMFNSIEEWSTSFNVYPNPSNGQFTIDASIPFNYTLTDSKGREVYVGRGNGGPVQLDTQLSTGVYILRLTDKEHSHTMSLLIQ